MDRVTAEKVATTFSLGRSRDTPQLVGRGAMGEMWRLDTDRGRWAVKRLFPWSDYPAEPFDIAVQRAAARAGIPLPLPVVGDNGAVVAIGDHKFRVYEWEDLAPALEPPIPTDRAAEAGGLLGRVHSLGLAAPNEPVDSWYVRTHDENEWRRLVARARRAGASWADALHERVPLMIDMRRRVEGAGGLPHLCHRDFGPDNVVPRASDDALVVLDWENVGPLPVEQELASALENWTTHDGRVERDAACRFFAAYRDGGGTAAVRDATAFSTSVCALLNFLHALAGQVLDEPQHRAFAEARVKEIVGFRLTNLAAVIDELVALDLR